MWRTRPATTGEGHAYDTSRWAGTRDSASTQRNHTDCKDGLGKAANIRLDGEYRALCQPFKLSEVLFSELSNQLVTVHGNLLGHRGMKRLGRYL